jgi:hypothetical protein
MKTEALATDINGILAAPELAKLADESLLQFSTNIALRARDMLVPREGSRRPATLYASELGKPCARQLWYKLNTPEAGTALEPHVRLKFMYGDVMEELALLLARAAGHEVKDEQMRVEHILPNGWRISGKIDAIINNEYVVDVKSASPFSFATMKQGLTDDNDKFGYRAQVGFYAKKLGLKPAILALDKVNGHVNLIELDPLPEDWEKRAEFLTKQLDSEAAPARQFLDVPLANGNKKLDTNCNYCDFKKECWPTLRGFQYSDKVMYLTEVKATPKVPEIAL